MPTRSLRFAEIIAMGGYRFGVEILEDSDAGPPWQEADGHGPVTDWIPVEAKRAGYRELVRDHGRARFYDWAEACRIAKRDQWGIAGGRRTVYRIGTAARRAFATMELATAAATEHHMRTGQIVEIRSVAEPLGAYRARAVEANYQYLRGWCQDEWRYCGVRVCLLTEDDQEDRQVEPVALWGVEDRDPAYLQTIARELVEEIIARIEVDQPLVWQGSD